MTDLTPSRLQAIFEYDAEAGTITRTARTESEPRGKVMGFTMANGYRAMLIYGKQYYVHRIAFAIAHGRWPTALIDHINGDPSDNRLSNLREATSRENSRNRARSADHGATFYRRYGKWRASVSVDGRQKHLGYFATKDEALAARVLAEKQHYGEFAPSRLTANVVQ